ncbi:MAG: IS1595 family transposase [Chloroflexi bacterium]|nr:IS1595 family transposase [Chloroflexota bacterium]
MHGEPNPKGEVIKLTDGTLTEADARAMLERIRWPHGPQCPFPDCKGEEAYRIEVKPSVRKSGKPIGPRHIFKCKTCKRQFSVTKGTIFEDSKIPLRTWIMVMYRMCVSKKGVSAHQIHREFGLHYEAAWFMCHRIRYAMQEKNPGQLKGIIEADEAYIGGKQRGHPTWKERIQDEIKMGLRAKRKDYRMDKAIVFGMLERDGKARTMHVDQATSKNLPTIMRENIDLKNSRLITDAHPAYRLIRKHLPHDVIRHEVEYVNGDVHIQGMENYWSILKRGIYGVFHHVDEEFLPCYLSEFEFRFNRRKVPDADRFYDLLRNVEGRLAWYLQPSSQA